MQTRYDLLNYLVKRYRYSSYLEIGCNHDATFGAVEIDEKVGVDPNQGGTVRMTSDDYFATLEPDVTFDLVFIDGLHWSEQVVRDAQNSITHLNPGGTIVFHDTNPAEEICQLRSRSIYKMTRDYPDFLKNRFVWNGLETLQSNSPKLLYLSTDILGYIAKHFDTQRPYGCSGDVWKAIVELRSRPDINICTPEVDLCSVLQVRQNTDPLDPVPAKHMHWNNLEKNREKWLRTISVEAFKEWLA